MPRIRKIKTTPPRDAQTYQHPSADLAARPEIGAQAHFKKVKAPATYRFDSSLAPELCWDGQNPAREQGEALIKAISEAKSLAEALQLRALSNPFLNWTGKAERLSFEVPTLPLFVHERLSTKAILETLKGHRSDKGQSSWVLLHLHRLGQRTHRKAIVVHFLDFMPRELSGVWRHYHTHY